MSNLTQHDLDVLASSWITPELALEAGIRRVGHAEGAGVVGRGTNDGSNYAGLVFPYVVPGERSPRSERLRRDVPDWEWKNGRKRDIAKYLGPPGRGNHFYFPPGTDPAWLADTTIPTLFLEGEKKALAMTRFSRERNEKRLVVGLPGVFGWRGVTEKQPGPNVGETKMVRGPINDFKLVNWMNRRVGIVFDSNTSTNPDVARARRELARELVRRGAVVYLVDLPQVENLNGIDDYLSLFGPDAAARVLRAAYPFPDVPKPAARTEDDDERRERGRFLRCRLESARSQSQERPAWAA